MTTGRINQIASQVAAGTMLSREHIPAARAAQCTRGNPPLIVPRQRRRNSHLGDGGATAVTHIE